FSLISRRRSNPDRGNGSKRNVVICPTQRTLKVRCILLRSVIGRCAAACPRLSEFPLIAARLPFPCCCRKELGTAEMPAAAPAPYPYFLPRVPHGPCQRERR